MLWLCKAAALTALRVGGLDRMLEDETIGIIGVNGGVMIGQRSTIDLQKLLTVDSAAADEPAAVVTKIARTLSLTTADADMRSPTLPA